MAKKISKKKATTRTATARKPSARTTSPKKSAIKTSPKSAAAKKSTAKPATKKAAPKKAAPKKTSKKVSAKKTVFKKVVKKTASKKPVAKKAAKKVAKKVAVKRLTAKKAYPKVPLTRKVAKKKAPQKKAGGSKKGADPKSGRQGITIVTHQRMKKTKAKRPRAAVPALSGSILGMGLTGGRPLIPSGPSVSPTAPVEAEVEGAKGKKPKSPFTKRQLDKYSEILILKRRALLGDIGSMEHEALKSESGALSHLPQHMAEQGSETYEQSLSLDLAAADRVLLREIDAAMERIANRTYGLCEHTGKPISKERLAELPWARYSIEAAREMERRTN